MGEDGQKSDTFNILSLDGGGYKGLFAVSFLSVLEKKFNKSCFEVFDLFAGTSTGSIIALALALGKSADDVKKAYLELGKKVFLEKKIPFFSAFYKNKILNQELDKLYEGKTLGDICSLNKKVVIPSVNLTNVSTKIFKTDYCDKFNQHNKYKLCDVATASSCAPFYFDSFKLKKPDEKIFEYFADGGLYANNPSVCAIMEAHKIMNVPLDKIRVLSIAMENQRISKRENKTRKGVLSWGLWNKDLIKIILKVSSMNQNYISEFLLKEKFMRIEPTAALENIELDDVSHDSCQILQNEGTDVANTACNTQFVKEIFKYKGENIEQHS